MIYALIVAVGILTLAVLILTDWLIKTTHDRDTERAARQHAEQDADRCANALRDLAPRHPTLDKHFIALTTRDDDRR